MIIEKAFAKLVKDENWHIGTGVDPSTARSHKMHFKQGKLSEPTMLWLLYKSGEIKISYKRENK